VFRLLAPQKAQDDSGAIVQVAVLPANVVRAVVVPQSTDGKARGHREIRNRWTTTANKRCPA
jgi:hypothetical protein